MIGATLISTGEFGDQLDVNQAVDAKFREAVERSYFRLDLHMNDNTTAYKKVGTIDFSQPLQASILGQVYEFTAADETDMLQYLNNTDVGWWLEDENGELLVISFHTMGNIEQDGQVMYEVNTITDGTYVPTVADVLRELAFRLSTALVLINNIMTGTVYPGFDINKSQCMGHYIGSPIIRWVWVVTQD